MQKRPFNLGEPVSQDQWRVGQIYYLYDKPTLTYHKITINRVWNHPGYPRVIYFDILVKGRDRPIPYAVHLDNPTLDSNYIMYKIDPKPLIRAVANTYLLKTAEINAKSKYGNNWRSHVMEKGIGQSANPNAGPVGKILDFLGGSRKRKKTIHKRRKTRKS